MFIYIIYVHVHTYVYVYVFKVIYLQVVYIFTHHFLIYKFFKHYIDKDLLKNIFIKINFVFLLYTNIYLHAYYIP